MTIPITAPDTDIDAIDNTDAAIDAIDIADTIDNATAADVLATIRRMRKGLRDVRDRAAARINPAWAGVAMAGMLNGDHLLMVVQHEGIDRDTLSTALERRWPQAVVAEFETVTPRLEMSVEHTVQHAAGHAIDHAVELALAHRGIEPIRIVVPAQIATSAPVDEWDEPMPLLF